MQLWTIPNMFEYIYKVQKRLEQYLSWMWRYDHVLLLPSSSPSDHPSSGQAVQGGQSSTQNPQIHSQSMYVPSFMHPPFILPSLGLIQSKCTLGEHKCIGVDSKSHCIPGFVLLYPAVFRVWGREYEWGRHETWQKHTLDIYLCILNRILAPPTLPGLGEGDLRGRRRGGGEHAHCDTTKEGNAKIPYGTSNHSTQHEFLMVSPFLECLIRSLGSWPHCWAPDKIIIYSSTWDVFLMRFNVSLILRNIVINSPSYSISS